MNSPTGLRAFRAAAWIAGLAALAAAGSAAAGHPRPEAMREVRELAGEIEEDAEFLHDSLRSEFASGSARGGFVLRAVEDLAESADRFHDAVDDSRNHPARTEQEFRRLAAAHSEAVRVMVHLRLDRDERRAADHLAASMARLARHYEDSRSRHSAWFQVRRLADRAEDQTELAYDLAKDEARGGFLGHRDGRREKALERFKELEKAADRHNDKFEVRPPDIDAMLRGFEKFIDRYNQTVERADAFGPRVQDALWEVGDYLYELERAYIVFLDTIPVYDSHEERYGHGPGGYDSRGPSGDRRDSRGATGGLKGAPGADAGGIKAAPSAPAGPSASSGPAGAGAPAGSENEPYLLKGAPRPKLQAPAILRRKPGSGAPSAEPAPAGKEGAAPPGAESPKDPAGKSDRPRFPEIKRGPAPGGPAGTSVNPPGLL